jgi:toxin ParE1/3/4
MLQIRIRAAAREDLKAIGRYTQKKWGREQRNRYLALIDESFHLLAVDPQKGRCCDVIRLGYRKYKVGRHVIFYRLYAAHLEIVRILHERMDVARHIY